MTEHKTSDFYAQTALRYGQFEIDKGVMLYSPEGMKRLNAKNKNTGEPFDHTEADYWIVTGGRIIPMYGAENITDFINNRENDYGIVIPVNFKTGQRL